MSKKGQLTVFIIAGILLLLVIGIVMYATRERAVAPIEAERIRITEVPTEMAPLRDFIQTCAYQVAKDGLQRLGERGGYIEPRQRYNPIEPTEGEAVQFAPDSQLIVPYWWHLSSRNSCQRDCQFASEQPPLFRNQGATSIESQLDRYLAAELPSCFRNFQQFREQQLIVTPVGDLKPETRITTGNVVVLLTYPLEVTRDGQRFELQDFVTELPVNFYEIYTLATNITNLQAEHSFIERATRSLIDVFGRTSDRALPPVSEMEFGFGTGTMWTKFEIIEKLQQMLTSYVPLLRVTYTRNYQYLPAPAGTDRTFYEVLYNRGFTVPVLDPHRTLAVKFAYLPWWKTYADLNCNGQVCQSEGFNSVLGFVFGVRRYNFAYDVSYPVLVDISNPDAYGGEGYSFRYFLEANMRNNEPLAVLGTPLDVPQIEERSSLLCDESQRTGGTMDISVRTSQELPVSGAEIIYQCGTESCGIGTTVSGRLVEKLPRCIGGFLTASHRDYAMAVEPLDVIDDTNGTANLIMATPYTVDFSVRKWPMKKTAGNWDLDPVLTQQAPSEKAIIMLERKGKEFEEPITVLSEVCGSPFAKRPIPCGTPPEDTSKGVRIYSGEYHATIYAFNYPSPALEIPPDRRCYRYRTSPFTRRTRCFWVPPKAIVFNTDKPYVSGYAEFDWSVTDEQLAGAKNIEFTYINFALDKVLPASNRKVEDLEIMGSLFSYSEQYNDLLKPRIT
jgi:hypothetical protein